jgi:hypothetical protein
MSFRRKMAKRSGPIIIWVLIVVFCVGIVAISSMSKNSSKHSNLPSNIDGSKVLAVVDGQKITALDFESQYADKVSDPAMTQQPGVTTVLNLRKMVFLELLQKTLVKAAMKRYHVRDNIFVYRTMAREWATVMTTDLRKEAEAEVKTLADNAKKDKKVTVKGFDEVYTGKMAEFMQRNGQTEVKAPTEKQFTNWYVNDLLLGQEKGKGMYDQFVDYGRVRQFGKLLIKGLPVDPFTEDFVKKLQTQEVKASWIVVNAAAQTPEELAKAEERAKAIHDDVVKNPASFAAVAKAKSDHTASKEKGGSLEWLKGDDPYSPVMAMYLAFSQQKGQISPVTLVAVPNAYGVPQVGYAILKVDAVRDRDPKTMAPDFNWEKQKADLIVRTRQSLEKSFGDTFLAANRAQVKVDVTSPEAKAYVAEDSGGPGGYVEANKDYQDALKETNIPDLVKGGINYKVSMSTPKMADKIPLLEEASQYASAEEISTIKITLARAYDAAGRRKDALSALSDAAEMANESDRSSRQQILNEYKRMGNAAGVKAMTEWLAKNKETAPSAPSSPMQLPVTHN